MPGNFGRVMHEQNSSEDSIFFFYNFFGIQMVLRWTLSRISCKKKMEQMISFQYNQTNSNFFNVREDFEGNICSVIFKEL